MTPVAVKVSFYRYISQCDVHLKRNCYYHHEYYYFYCYYYLDDLGSIVMEMTGYRNDYNVADVIDLNNATCQQVTTPLSDKAFVVRVELPTATVGAGLTLTLTAVLDGGECLDFPATMVYTEGDPSIVMPFQNNPAFCDNQPGNCVFECDCSDVPCHFVYLVVLSAPNRQRGLCEIFLEWN